MKSQVLNNFEFTWMTVVAFFIFVTFFISMIVWTFRKGSKELYKSVGDLPFEDPKKANRSKS